MNFKKLSQINTYNTDTERLLEKVVPLNLSDVKTLV